MRFCRELIEKVGVAAKKGEDEGSDEAPEEPSGDGESDE